MTPVEVLKALFEGKIAPDAELQVQMSSPNGHTFATGVIKSIFHNGNGVVVDVYVTDSEMPELMDSTEDEDEEIQDVMNNHGQ